MVFLSAYAVLLICTVEFSTTDGADTGCLPIYLRYSKEHTGCRDKSPCNPEKRGISDEDKMAILTAHNDYRTRIATGQETTYPLPVASNMLQMVWDPELEAIAQAHADQCKFDHDCNDCRAVKNFKVGQNLYTRMSPTKAPESADWVGAIKSWYDEVKDVKEAIVENYQDSGGPPTGHFTQVIWAATWRIGCGYSVYKKDNVYTELYSCNYGPAGNHMGHSVYEKGNTCSKCPINSCCGNSCKQPGLEGLCQILGESAPQYNITSKFVFSCRFNEETDCKMNVSSGVDKWEISKTLTGSFAGIVLQGGESTTLNFVNVFKSQDVMCVQLTYRKGPLVDGEKSSHTAEGVFCVPSSDQCNRIPLQNDPKSFMKFLITLPYKESTLSISFSVPQEASPQYLEIADIRVTEGQCKN